MVAVPNVTYITTIPDADTAVIPTGAPVIARVTTEADYCCTAVVVFTPWSSFDRYNG